MLFISAEDFFSKVAAIPPLTREEERALAFRKEGGDTAARQRLMEGYLPFVAAVIRRTPEELTNYGKSCIKQMKLANDKIEKYLEV